MSEHTAISWADSTFNPWMGCTKVSPACDHCYAERQMDHRMHKVRWGAGQPRVRTSAANWQQPLAWERAAWRFVQCAACGRRGPAIVSNGTTRCGLCNSQAVTPARRRVFCASVADVFDNEVPHQWRFDLLNLIADTPQLDWLLLTKRIGNAQAMLDAFMRSDGHPGEAWDGWPNVWLGITVVNQEEADRDIPKLLAVPAAVRFLSIEPMLGPVDLDNCTMFNSTGLAEGQPYLSPLRGFAYDGHGDTCSTPRIDWIICGGESGPHARPMHPDWVRSLRDQCAGAGVPFHLKQWGEYTTPVAAGVPPSSLIGDDRVPGHVFDDGRHVVRVGTKAAGRLLDGIEHNGFPA